MPINGYLGGVISATAPTVNSGVASGIFTLEEQMQAAGQGNWPGYQISRSVRLRSSASAYFNRTPSGAGNQQKWTWSGWVKRGQTTDTGVFGVGTSGSNYFNIRFQPDYLSVVSETPSLTIELRTSALYRDYSAWYHIVFALDTTQATASDRAKLYVNGVQVTSFSTANYPSLNANLLANSAVAHYLGVNGQATGYADGYFTEVNFVNAQQLAPTSFGAFDAVTGVWNPIRYSGTYGTNGFYLNFSDPTSTTTIGYDYSGNSNNWTANNISVTAGITYDSMVDSPTNYGEDTGIGGVVRGNYAVLNAVQPTGATYSNGNLFCSGAVQCGGVSSLAMSSGKWYAEVVYASGSNANIVGIMNASVTNVANTEPSVAGSGGVGYYALNGNKYIETTASAYGATYTTGDLISIAIDMDNNTVQFYKNGVGQGVISTTINNSPKVFTSGNRSPASHSETWNFGQRAFSYTAPSGFKALCTQNFTTPTISNGANYMAATLYTGTGASLTVSNAVNSISFQPDMVWIKSRSAATDHKLTDSVRGATLAVISNSSAAETTDSTGLTAFGSSGFTVGANTTYNNSGATYIGWQWKGGGTAVTNTAGSITSSVSANTTAGFSVVTYTGTIANATVGHGLGVAPRMIIARNRTNVVNWIVYHANLTSASYYLTLDETNGQTNNSIFWQGVAPTSTVFSLGANSSCNGNTSNVAYCFAPIAGYSAFGSFVGNGVVDGPFIYLGFRPRYVLVKVATASSSWAVIDSSRDTYNVTSLRLLPSSALNEAPLVDPTYDFLANGFKLRTDNATENYSGQTIIYAAFAENPFTISRAR